MVLFIGRGTGVLSGRGTGALSWARCCRRPVVGVAARPSRKWTMQGGRCCAHHLRETQCECRCGRSSSMATPRQAPLQEVGDGGGRCAHPFPTPTATHTRPAPTPAPAPTLRRTLRTWTMEGTMLCPLSPYTQSHTRHTRQAAMSLPTPRRAHPEEIVDGGDVVAPPPYSNTHLQPRTYSHTPCTACPTPTHLKEVDDEGDVVVPSPDVLDPPLRHALPLHRDIIGHLIFVVGVL